jgi:nitroreductase
LITPAEVRTEWAAEALEGLLYRHSIGPKQLAPPAPSHADWCRAGDLALRAPDHGGLRPFRFVVVADAQRAALAALFAQDARRRGHAEAEVARAHERAFNGPGLAALVGRLQEGRAEVPVHEQWVCIGGALMNCLNALHLMGFGAKALSGASVADPAIRAAFCDADETLVCWVIAGTPTRAAHPKGHGGEARVVSHWQPPPAGSAG